jgi:nitroreductase
VDTYLAIVSLRAVRRYSDRPIEPESMDRILQAARSTGSSVNKQPWKFYVVQGAETRKRLEEAVWAPENLVGCQVAIGIVTSGKGGFDAGRVAQNIMLAAWNEGIGSVPNGIKDGELVGQVLELPEGHSPAMIISFGYPETAAQPSDDPEGILRRINRKPLEELVVRVD